MAEMQDTRPLAAPGQRTSFSTITNLLGAAASLALVVGVAVWTYQILMRDVSGVPVVRATEGPMRVQPENPGGQQAQHQGLSVNDVAAEGGAAAPADRLVLAPQPLNLTAEDEALPSVSQSIPQTSGSQQAAVQDQTQPGLSLNPEDIQLAAVEQLAAQLAEGVQPLQELEPLSDAVPASEEEVQAVVAAATGVTPDVVEPDDMDAAAAIDAAVEVAVVGGGLGRSLRPKLRPTTLSNVQPVAAVTGASVTAIDGVRDVDPASIAAGTRLAQLGAYDSPEVARAEWDRLSDRFDEYLNGKDRVIQRATSGGRTFYRLRAMGFADLSDARRFCSALVAEKAECIPVVTR